jgi:hypothetical protein
MDAVNIGARESQKRLAAGVTMLVVGIGAAVAFSFIDVNRAWRLGVFVPFWMGALGLLQAQRKT